MEADDTYIERALRNFSKKFNIASGKQTEQSRVRRDRIQ